MDLFEELSYKIFPNNFHGADDFAHGNYYYYLKIFMQGSFSLA
jgi:hypothetical protein